MADHEDPQSEAHAKEEESIFVLRMVGVEEPDGVLVVESRAGFLEGDAVLPNVCSLFAFIPLESQLIHTYIVWTIMSRVKSHR